MSKAPAKELLAFWLVPTEPARSYFVSLIRDFAARFDAPIFEPHVTLHGTDPGGEDGQKLVNRVVARTKRCRLRIAGIGHSQKFTKTLFVQFDPGDEVAALSAKFRAASKSPVDYELNPHLSLIYKELPAEEKAVIAAELNIPFREVTFDLVKAVVSPAEIKSQSAVEAWRVVAETRLG